MIEWTPELEDRFLESILPCNSDLVYQRHLYGFGQVHGTNPKILEQWLRRRSVKLHPYFGPFTQTSRSRRDGVEFSWVEMKILSWALNPFECERRNDVTVQYLANLLQRSQEEINVVVEKLQNERHGIRPFF